MLYSAFRPLLFALDPEQAHRAVFSSLDVAARLGVASLLVPRVPASPVRVMGLDFPNRIGLAAGLDKNAEHIDGLARLGFGFIECGTVTPRAQPGNPRPRLFRLIEAEALINRMGFNNEGLEPFLQNAARASFRGILGLNIGKNFDTPNERAVDDYLTCLRAVYERASYVAVNISSPNTKGLRELQAVDALHALLSALKREQTELSGRHGKYTPIAVKIAPDLEPEAIDAIARLLVAERMDAVIATNTTTSRVALQGLAGAEETGGLSGRPLRAQATAVVRRLAQALDGALPIIGVGGIMSGADAVEKIEAGATLVQIYTGLVYRGPDLVAECARAVAEATTVPA
ncbi:MAG TPA: quinone-dependent dihydroorotate dehydrogenase [Casimicrobiaceae bacterium]|nr:quinone-dependent dihydroorotate dehydrogenase [Casimicrobiaceae bacterium]